MKQQNKNKNSEIKSEKEKLNSKQLFNICIITVILCITLIFPGCISEKRTQTINTVSDYGFRNILNGVSNNQNDYEDTDENESDYVGIWVSKPMVSLGIIYAEAIEICMYDGETVEFERREYIATKKRGLVWEEDEKSRIHKTTEIKKGYIKHGIPYFDLYNPERYNNHKIYIDDVLYYGEYETEEKKLYPSDFTSMDNCIYFLNDIYNGEYTSDLDEIEFKEDKGTVSDYTEEDFIPEYDKTAITVDMIKDLSISINKQIEKMVEKDNKNFIFENTREIYFTFSADKNFSGDIKKLEITVWEECIYEDLETADETGGLIWKYFKATGTFENITKIEYPDEDFDWNETQEEMISEYFQATQGYDYTGKYIHVDDDSDRLLFVENENTLDYLYHCY